jgi:Skp family chaperone for outer membrane proteins
VHHPCLVVRRPTVPRFAVVTAVAATLLVPLTSGRAQPAQAPDYFIPNQSHPSAPSRPAVRPAAGPVAPTAGAEGGAAADAEQSSVTPQQLQLVLPPPVVVPQIPKGGFPPAAIMGVISVPDVMRGSNAYQVVDKELGARRQKLNEDAQKEQTTLRDLGQALTNDRGKMTPDQIRAKERELQDRIAESRRKFAERNRIIQEAGQYALAQIERTLRDVVQQVAVSHGMNMVLHAPQTALYLPEFDITPQVTAEINTVLPSVSLPPDGVSVLQMKPQAAAPVATPAAASVPAKPAPAKKP